MWLAGCPRVGLDIFFCERVFGRAENKAIVGRRLSVAHSNEKQGFTNCD